MQFDADLNACGALVEKGDPDRFAATMASPVAARRILFPIYAFNVEVSRAPWLTQEPMIAEMRLQWWRDALEEIAEGNPARRHEVVTPLAAVIDAAGAGLLDRLVAARRWDIGNEAFENEAALWQYLEATTANLLWTAAQALGAPDADETGFRGVARPVALANWMQALPELEARGKRPMHDGRPETLSMLADRALMDLNLQSGLSTPSRLVLISGWRARRILRIARVSPHRIARGQTTEPAIFRSATLILSRLRHRI